MRRARAHFMFVDWIVRSIQALALIAWSKTSAPALGHAILEAAMLSKCANPTCSDTFRYLHEGRLFHVAVGLAPSDQAASFERFWLCGTCSRKMTVVSSGLGIQVVFLKQPSEPQEDGITAALCAPRMSGSSPRIPLICTGGTYVGDCTHTRPEKEH